MHELGLLDAMLRTVEDVMQEEKLTRVEKIVLEVGAISGVVPVFLEESYPIVVQGTPFENTQMEIEIVPGRVRCNNCGREYDADLFTLQCPCGVKDLTPLAGRDFMIKEILGC